MLIRAAAHNGDEIDWGLIADYLRIFCREVRLRELERWYGEAD